MSNGSFFAILRYDSMNRFTKQAGITAINSTTTFHQKDEFADANHFWYSFNEYDPIAR